MKTLPGPSRLAVRRWSGYAAAVWRRVWNGFGAQGATEPQAEAAGRSGGSPLDCPGLRGTAQGAGQLDAAIAGQWTGGKGDSREQSYARIRPVQRRLTGESALRSRRDISS